MKKLLLTCAGLAVALINCTATVRATPTENNGLRILPAPGPVVIDGKANDWDLSGGLFACDDVENQRDKMAVWLYAMHDSQNLYLLAHFLDRTPLNNPGQTIADYGFAGDSFQFRIITNQGTPDERFSHWTNWRGRDQRDIMDIAYGRQFDQGSVKNAKDQGAQQAFSVDPNGQGYLQEMAIPWKLLTKSGAAPSPSAKLALTIEPNFTIGINGRVSVKDNFAPGLRPDRVFTFMSSNIWGPATLEAHGHVAPRPVRLADGRLFPVTLQNGVPVVNWTGLIQVKELPGFKSLTFTMPQDGYISLNIKDQSGTVKRQLLNSAFYTKGPHTVKWDGLTNPNAKLPGDMVAPGRYTWSALWNTGIGLKLRGWADNGGRTPWDNGPGTNWGGDQGDPCATAADETQVYLGWTFAEAGQALLACDQSGNVKWSNKRGGIAGVHGLAAADGAVYVLGGLAGPDSAGGALYKLAADTGRYLPWGSSPEADLKIKSLFPNDEHAPETADYVAAGAGKIYLAFSKSGNIAVLDAQSGKLLDTLKISSPGPMHWLGNKLYVVVQSQGVQELDLTSGARRTVVDGLTHVSALTVSRDGQVFVGTLDPDNQVKSFTLQGKATGTLGRRGGRNLLGPWTPDGLRFIQSIALAGDGKLWVAEQDGFPKRVSAWDTRSGALWKEFFGSTSYGALGGAIDPLDPDVMVGQGCEWRLNEATGAATCVSVITRDGMSNSRFGTGNGGRLYLAVAPEWMGNVKSTSIYERVGAGVYKLRSRFTYENEDPKTRLATLTRYWADSNGDELEQPGEITTTNASLRFSGWFMSFTPAMTIYSGDEQLKVQGFTPAGAPLYDIAHPVHMPSGASSGLASNDSLGSTDDRFIVYNGHYAVDRDLFTAYDTGTGQKIWDYPNNFIGVHGSHNATPAEVGMIRGAYGFAGTARLAAPIGNIWVVATNVGEWHVLTQDGFYLTRLFQGDLMKQQWPQVAAPGVPMDNVPPGMGGEDFGGSVTLGADGRLYLQAGKTAFWNLEVTGLDSVKAMSGGSIQIAASDQKQMRELREEQLQHVVGRKSLEIRKNTPQFTGNLDADFKGAATATWDKGNLAQVRAAAAWDDQALYLGYDVMDNTPWQNSAKTPEEMYLSGDTVDFQLGTNPSADAGRGEAGLGDLRVSIGDLNGVPNAVLYRKVSALKRPHVFSSGVIAGYHMDYVDVIASARIKVVRSEGHYTVEAAIPTDALGFSPNPGLVLPADFGVTYGMEGGVRTRLRSYWNNQHTGIVDDAVFELMMEPRYWGQLQFLP